MMSGASLPPKAIGKKILLTLTGAIVLPFLMVSALIWSIPRDSTDQDLYILIFSVITGFCCLIQCPIRTNLKIIFTVLYIPLISFSLFLFKLYFIYLVYGK